MVKPALREQLYRTPKSVLRARMVFSRRGAILFYFPISRLGIFQNEVAQIAAIESLKDKKFILKSIKHNIFYAEKIKKFLSKYNITTNKISANFLLLNFSNCKLTAKNFYNKLKTKGVILRSTEDGYKIKNMLRLTIGSKKDNLKFISSVKKLFIK